MWREVVKTSRCLVPAVGWYEWKEAEVTDSATGEIKKAKQPHFVHLPSNSHPRLCRRDVVVDLTGS